MLECGSNFLQHEYVALDAHIVEEARAHGFGVWAWTVDEIADMQRVASLDVFAVVTNHPDRALAALSNQ